MLNFFTCDVEDLYETLQGDLSRRARKFEFPLLQTNRYLYFILGSGGSPSKPLLEGGVQFRETGAGCEDSSGYSLRNLQYGHHRGINRQLRMAQAQVAER